MYTMRGLLFTNKLSAENGRVLAHVTFAEPLDGSVLLSVGAAALLSVGALLLSIGSSGRGRLRVIPVVTPTLPASFLVSVGVGDSGGCRPAYLVREAGKLGDTGTVAANVDARAKS